MNRIRFYNNVYQVLITPDYKVIPDNSLLIGNFSDSELKNYTVLEFTNLNDALAEAMNYVDIEWFKMCMNHKYIFANLEATLKGIFANYKLNVEFKPKLLSPEELKNVMFKRTINYGERTELKYGLNDIISFTIISPFSQNLHYISKLIQNYRSDTYRDDLRIRSKKIIDGKIIYLYGFTEYGTVYSIKLIPTLLNQAVEWKNNGNNIDDKTFNMQYNKMFKMQQDIDNAYSIN